MIENFTGLKRKSEVPLEIDESENIYPYLKSNCSFETPSNCFLCQRDLRRSVRFVFQLKEEYCIECLTKITKNPEEFYYLFDKLDFHIFTEDWTAKEEVFLLNGIEKYGLDNWEDISEYITTKSKFQCESHYYSFYTNKTDFPDIIKSNINKVKLNQIKENEVLEKVTKKQGVIPEFSSNENKLNSSRSIVKNRTKDKRTIITAAEIIGYWKKREEFEIEFLNEAELDIAELEFNESDTQEDTELKFNVLNVYNKQLQSRYEIKKFIIANELLDIRKTMAFESQLPSYDREIYNSLKPFLRFMTKEGFMKLFEGIILEKYLKSRIKQLQNYQYFFIN